MEAESREGECPPGHRLYRPVRWLLALNVLAFLLLATLVFQNSTRAPKQTWEYKIEDISDSGFVDRMNVLGQQGWELTSARRADDGQSAATGYEVIFKRPGVAESK